MLAYIKNCGPCQKEVTPYKKVNKEKPDLKYLRAIGSWTWVDVSKKLKKS